MTLQLIFNAVPISTSHDSLELDLTSRALRQALRQDFLPSLSLDATARPSCLPHFLHASAAAPHT